MLRSNSVNISEMTVMITYKDFKLIQRKCIANYLVSRYFACKFIFISTQIVCRFNGI